MNDGVSSDSDDLPHDHIVADYCLRFLGPFVVLYVAVRLQPDPLLALSEESIEHCNTIPMVHHCRREELDYK